MRRTQVAIIGGGPAGLLLSHMLHLSGIDSVVLERQTMAYVLKRIRAGVLEYGSVKLLREAGVGERMDREGHMHDGTLDRLAGPRAVPHRHQETHRQADVVARPDGDHRGIVPGAGTRRRLHRRGGPGRSAPRRGQRHAESRYKKGGVSETLECDFIAGCDGFHGVSRRSIPSSAMRIFERSYPFGWLGVMSETPPVGGVIYARHERGFALASLRSEMLSRYYIQCDLDTDIGDWPDERFWEELKRRFPADIGTKS